MSDTNQFSTMQTAEPHSSEPAPPRRKRILLAEGDGFTRLVLLFRLRLAGFQVDFTSNGILAMGKLQSGPPDALLVELKLGGLSGLELIRAARKDPAFGNRPICVFTYADKMNRSTRKEVRTLATTVYDKALMTREEVVQTFAALLRPPEPVGEAPPVNPAPELHQDEEEPDEMPLPGALEEIIAGVREQSKVVGNSQAPDASATNCEELLSRVRSLASCAEAARLSDLARQAKALENFLNELCKAKKGCSDTALSTVTRAVEAMDIITRQPTGENQTPSQINVVVVDEAPPSNIAITGALMNAGFEPISFEDASCAREYLASSFTNLIIVNVPLPEAHGLAAADIQALPLHGDTPLIYVPEPTVPKHSMEELSTSAPRLDTNPLLLTELVLQALNLVRCGSTSPVAATASSASAAASESMGTSDSQPSPGGGDYFEMFAGPKGPDNGVVAQAPAEPEAFVVQEPAWAQPAAANAFEPQASLATEEQSESHTGKTNLFTRRLHNSAAQSASVPAEPLPEPAAWPQEALPEEQPAAHTAGQPEVAMTNPVESDDALFAAASLPGENRPPAEPGVSGGEHQAETWSMLPAMPIDGQQTEDQQIQMTELSHVQPEAPELTAPDQTLDTGTAPAEAVAGSETAPAETLEPTGALSAAAPSEAPLIWALPASPPDEGQGANGQFQELQHQVVEASQNGAEGSAAPTAAESQVADEAEQPAHMAEAVPAVQTAELEQQVRQSVAALARATAELANERGERQRSEHRTLALTARLQELHEELGSTLQAHRESLERISALDEKLRQTDDALARRTADVEQQQAERQLAEEQLHKARELNAQLRKDLAFLDDANKAFDRVRKELEAKLEASQNAARESETRFHGNFDDRQDRAEALGGIQRELQNQSRKRENLQRELQTTLEALHESEARCQQESAERQRLKAALESAELSLRERSQRSDLEFCKLESALQLEQAERLRQERQLARARHASVDSVRAARGLRKSLRRQIREPVDNLYHSARHLLELELGAEQKKVAEAVLQEVLLVHTRLREPEPTQAESSDTQTTIAVKPL